jgi:uncharacterized membrane-anchored protein
MKHILWVVGLVALISGVVCWTNSQTALSIILGLISFVLLAVFFFMMFRDEGKQDISITKF